MSQLVDIETFIPNIVIDLKYATEHNFTGKVIYDFNRCYLINEVASSLKNVAEELIGQHLKLLVWDGFRPLSAQWKLWEFLPDSRYVSDPNTGGRHTRGTAVDLTLIHLDGNELEMPTAFDDFSEAAHADATNLPDRIINNREILKSAMVKHGFIVYPNEWWHFDYKDWESKPVVSPEEYDPLFK